MTPTDVVHQGRVAAVTYAIESKNVAETARGVVPAATLIVSAGWSTRSPRYVCRTCWVATGWGDAHSGTYCWTMDAGGTISRHIRGGGVRFDLQIPNDRGAIRPTA